MTSPLLSLDSRRSVRQMVQATLIVLGVVGLFVLLFHYRAVLLLMLAAFMLNVAITPAVNWLISKGRSRPIAVSIVYSVALGLVSLFVVLVGPVLFSQVTELTGRFPDYYDRLRMGLLNSANYGMRRVAESTPATLAQFQASLNGKNSASSLESAALASVANFWQLLRSGIGYILVAGAIFVLAYYLNIENQRVKLWLLRFAPSESRESLRSRADQIEATVGGFLGGQLLLGGLIGIASLVIYLAIGLPYAAALAVLAGIFELIPMVGPALTAVAAMLVALIHDPSKVGWVLASAVLLQALENYILVPRVMGKTVGINPFVSLLALAAFGALFGIGGALMAIPIAATLQIIFNSLVFNLDQQGWNTMTSRSRLGLLRFDAHNLVYDVRKSLRRKPVPSTEANDYVEETVEALAAALERLAHAAQLAEEVSV